MLKRMIHICLCVFMIITSFKPIYAIEPSTYDLDFHMFLANYLDQNAMFERLDQPMAHHFLYESMKKEFGEDNILLSLTNMANDWGRTLNGQTGVYEQVILEILVNYVNSPFFQERALEKKINTEYEIIQFINKSFDFDCLKEDNQELFSILSRLDFKSWKDVAKIPDEVFNKNIMNFIKHFEIPISDSFYFNLEMDILDFLLKVSAYRSICYELDGIEAVLEEMIHYTRNAELKTAIQNVLRKVDAAKSPDLWELIEADSQYLAKNMFSSLIKDVVLTSLSIVGLSIETSGFLSNTIFKTDVISESYLLLKSEMDVESLIKDVIRAKVNTYMFKKDDAKDFNYSFMLLYSAYEYGTQITNNYGKSIYKSLGRLFNQDLYVKFFQDVLKFDLKVKTYSYQDFLNSIHTWEGIIANDRTLFESAWLEYKERYISVKDSMEDGFGKNYVNSIYFEQQHISIKFQDAQFSYPLTSCKSAPNQVPMMYTYQSSDSSIVSIENEHVYSIKAHKPGTVTITATSEDGMFHATQRITIIDSKTSIHKGEDLVGDYDDCYIENEDGITLTKLSTDFLEKEKEIFHSYYKIVIPGSINGKTVTEIDFDHLDLHKIGYGGDEIIGIVIPGNVKRIASAGLADLPRKCEIVLNEGLEEIGDHAFGSTVNTIKDMVLPTTLKSIGIATFCGYNSIYINCPQLKEIPRNAITNNRYVTFSNDMKQLKVINEYGLISNGLVVLPDCVEIMKEKAMWESTLYRFPSSLKEIGRQCFEDATILSDTLPESVEKIGVQAFEDTNLTYLYIPNSIKMMESYAFGNIDNIYTYGEASNTDGEIVNHMGWFDYFEIPDSVTKIGECLMCHNMVWTNGIDEIVCSDRKPNTSYEKTQINMYLREIGRNGTYSLKNHIFSLNCYFNYIEIPVNYLKNTKNTLYGDWIKDCVIIGDASEKDLKRYVEILKDAIDVGGTITYRDDKGNMTLLYQYLPLSYEKESKSIYEMESDYTLDSLSLMKNQMKDSVGDLNITVSANSKELKKVSLKCWKDEKESEAQRAQALNEFFHFEDVYLKQHFYRYFTIDTNAKCDEYVIELEIANYYLAKSGYGLYYIDESQRITRIPISYVQGENGYRIRFQIERLGSFAFVRLNKQKERIERTYQDEYHMFIEEGVINQDSSFHYLTNDGTQSFAGTNDANTTISKPINKQDKELIEDEIIQQFELNDTLIHRKEESKEITDEMIEDYQMYDSLMNNAVFIETRQTDTIHLSLDKLKNKSYQFYLYQIGKDNKLAEVKRQIQSIKKNKVNVLLLGDNQNYYEIKLDEGNYLFTYIVTDKTSSIISQTVVSIFGVILVGVLIVGFIIMRRRKR